MEAPEPLVERMEVPRVVPPLAAGVAIWLAVILCGWANYPWGDYVIRVFMEGSLQAIAQTAEEIREKTGRYPASMEELIAKGRELKCERLDRVFRDGEAVDTYGNPFIFTLRDGKPFVRSLGRDGMESADDWTFPPSPRPWFQASLSQYGQTRHFHMANRIGLLAGGLTSGLWLLAIFFRHRWEPVTVRWTTVLGWLLVTAVAGAVAFYVLFLHSISGH
jgi:hypothetical protein